MRYIESEIWLALKKRIDTLATDPIMPVFAPDATIVPPSDASGPLPFILTSDVRNDTVRVGIDPRLQIRSGTLMLSIQWPIAREVSHSQLMQLGGSVTSHFPADTRMRIGSTCLRVIRDADCMQPYREGAYRVVTVRVFWSTA